MKKGFGMIEIVLSVALLGIILAVAQGVFTNLYTKNEALVASNYLQNGIHEAYVRSKAVSGDADWGVNVATGTVTVFRGSSYAGRDTDFDTVFSFSNIVDVSGDTEYVFNKQEGKLVSAGTTTLALYDTQYDVAVNIFGTVVSSFTGATSTDPEPPGDGTCLNQNANIDIDISGAFLTPNNRELHGITFENTNATCDVIIDQVYLLWINNTNRTLRRIRIDNTTVWQSTATSGSVVDINDTTLANVDGPVEAQFRFNNSVSGSSFVLGLYMSDGTFISAPLITP